MTSSLDACLRIETSETTLGTMQAGDSFVFDIAAEVVTPSPQAGLLAVSVLGKTRRQRFA